MTDTNQAPPQATATPQAIDLATHGNQLVTFQASGETRTMTLAEAIRFATSGVEAEKVGAFNYRGDAQKWTNFLQQYQSNPQGIIDNLTKRAGLEVTERAPAAAVDPNEDPDLAALRQKLTTEFDSKMGELDRRLEALDANVGFNSAVSTFTATYPDAPVDQVVEFARQHGLTQEQLGVAYNAMRAEGLLQAPPESSIPATEPPPDPAAQAQQQLAAQKLNLTQTVLPGATQNPTGALPTQSGPAPEPVSTTDPSGRSQKKTVWDSMNEAIDANGWDINQPFAMPEGSTPAQSMDGWN